MSIVQEILGQILLQKLKALDPCHGFIRLLSLKKKMEIKDRVF